MTGSRTLSWATRGQDAPPPRRNPRPWIGLPLVAIALLAAAGCGDGKIARYPTTGQVLVNGKPVANAIVMFCPIDGSADFQKERPLGITDDDGRFQMTTFLKGDGAPAGNYDVMIRQRSPSSKEEAEKLARGPKIARQYFSPKTSGLKVTVEAMENELQPFDLESPRG